MNESQPNRFRRVSTHIKNNADIYVPAALIAIGIGGLVLIGIKYNKDLLRYEQQVMDALAKLPEGSRLLIDARTGDYVLAEPAPVV